ncbi:MAG: GH3 family acyl-acid amido synthetase, partial [Planctomycetota bacterium]
MSDIEGWVEAGVAKRMATLRTLDERYEELQRDKLAAIVRNTAETEFGRAHGFDRVGSPKDYQRAVPLSIATDYDAAWKRIAKGERNVLFPEPVHAYALSSGTTGEPKTVPLNKALVRGLKRAIGYTTAAHMARTGNFSLLRGYALQMTAPAQVRQIEGVPVGYITGIMGAAKTYPFHNIGIPPVDVLDLMDWEEKYTVIEERYAGHDVRMILGIPGYMLALFDRLTRRRGAKSLAALWPHLELVVTSGTALEYHRDTLAALCPDAELLEMYLATEAAIAFQPEPEPGL